MIWIYRLIFLINLTYPLKKTSLKGWMIIYIGANIIFAATSIFSGHYKKKKSLQLQSTPTRLKIYNFCVSKVINYYAIVVVAIVITNKKVIF